MTQHNFQTDTIPGTSSSASPFPPFVGAEKTSTKQDPQLRPDQADNKWLLITTTEILRPKPSTTVSESNKKKETEAIHRDKCVIWRETYQRRKVSWGLLSSAHPGVKREQKTHIYLLPTVRNMSKTPCGERRNTQHPGRRQRRSTCTHTFQCIHKQAR